MKRHLITTAIAATVALSGVTRATADGGDFIAGAIIGGLAGAAINQNANNKKRQRTVVYRDSAYSAQRAENVQVQTALNYFGFNAGTPDGVMGGRSRAAVSAYQATMGYPSTGYIAPYETSFLLSSYQRAMAGGGYEMASLGGPGLLRKWRDEAQGGGASMAAAPAPVVPVAPAPQTVVVPAAPEVAPAPVPAPVEAAAPSSSLPSFMADGTTQVSLASHCNKVSLMTSTNGGFTTLATMTDPTTTLNEQFCLARTYAIATGEELAGKVQGFTPAQIETQCKGFGEAMVDPIDSLSIEPAAAVLKETSEFIRSTGMAPAQLAGTAKICLSVGYRTDDMDTAMGSALILTALGEQAYGELLGHHLDLGFGASQRADLAQDWYRMGVSAIESGAAPVFAPGQPERTALIKAAVFGKDQSPTVVPAAEAAPAAPGAKLPGFSINN